MRACYDDMIRYMWRVDLYLISIRIGSIRFDSVCLPAAPLLILGCWYVCGTALLFALQNVSTMILYYHHNLYVVRQVGPPQKCTHSRKVLIRNEKPRNMLIKQKQKNRRNKKYFPQKQRPRVLPWEYRIIIIHLSFIPIIISTVAV